MSYAQERVDIESRLETGWTTTDIAWYNVPYVPVPGTAFIRCTILPGEVERLSFGRDTVKEYDGIIDIGIFTPKSTGSAIGWGYSDTLFALFNMVEFGTIDCDEAVIKNLGSEEDWYHLSISVPFMRRE